MTKAKLVLHHDDPPCEARLCRGHCPACDLTPDMQSTCLYLYCPTCDVSLEEGMKCPKCGQTFERPDL